MFTAIKSPLFFMALPMLAILSACSALTGKNDVPNITTLLRDTTGQNGRACIRTSDIQGYGVERNEVINIDATRHYYIATLRPGCMDVSTSTGIIFGTDFHEVCGGRIDTVITQQGECTINQIFEFENREAAFKAYADAVEKRNMLRAQDQ